MSAWKMRPGDRVMEAAPALEVYIEGIAAIEQSYGNFRVSFSADETPVDVPGAKPHQMVKVRLIGPIECFRAIAILLLECSPPNPTGSNVISLLP